MKLVLGVSGSIAASLIPGWVTYLRYFKAWETHVLLTESATRFVSPVALQAISGHPVWVGSRWMDSGHVVHKEITRDADLVAVAPCTVNTFAKLGAGLADDSVSLVAAFATCPVLLFPAFGPDEVGRLWPKLERSVAEVGYHVSQIAVPAREVSDGSLLPKQGFPTIDVFEREVARVLKSDAAA